MKLKDGDLCFQIGDWENELLEAFLGYPTPCLSKYTDNTSPCTNLKINAINSPLISTIVGEELMERLEVALHEV